MMLQFQPDKKTWGRMLTSISIFEPHLHRTIINPTMLWKFLLS